jgi:hypothetical protein
MASSSPTLSLPIINLSAGQVDHLLKHVLNDQPLTGRNVLIPMVGGQAFRCGRLEPTRDSESGQEQVVVHDSSSSSTIATTETKTVLTYPQAKEWLTPAASKPQPPSATSTPSKSSLKASKAVRPTKPPPPPPPPTSEVPLPTTNELPFFDIQEEYDPSGKPVRATKINVTKQLESLMSNNMPTESAAANDPPQPPAQAEIEEEEEEEEDYSMIVGPKLPPVSDKEYQRLSNTLDQLARLEEENETRHRRNDPATIPRRTNKTPTKKSSSSTTGGWSKGFLNKSTTSKSSTQPKQSKSKSSVETTTQQPTAAAASRVVSFGENQVQEIPRIGTTSAATLQRSPSKPIVVAAAAATTSPPPRRPLDSSIFSGVIQERSGNTQTTAARQQQQPPQQQQPQQPQQPSTKPKRISRFAQDRQEQGM